VHSMRTILDRIALPFAAFGVALLVLLLIAQFFVLPFFNRFQVDGKELNPGQLSSYLSQTKADVTKAESQRDALVLPGQDQTYLALKTAKENEDVFLSTVSAVRDSAKQATNSGTILFNTFAFDAPTMTMTVTGDVRDAGPTSMTVLAGFIDTLESLPIVSHMQRPSFERYDDAGIGPHSPFTFSFTVIHPSDQ